MQRAFDGLPDLRTLRLHGDCHRVECYGRELAQAMEAIVQQKLRDAREVTLAEADGRPVLAKLRDAAARLFSPFL